MNETSPSSVSFSQAYRPYLSIVETSICIVGALIAIVLYSRLIYHSATHSLRLRVQQLSKSLWTYLVVHCVGCALILPTNFYQLLRWSPSGGVFDPYTLYWLGQLQATYYTVSPIPILFLTIDRSLVVLHWLNIAHLRE